MNGKKKHHSGALSKSQIEALSEFRYQLRRFLRFSEKATRQQGVTPLQYQVLLHVRGFPDRDWATVGEIAERLQAQPHGVLALITRCESNGLVHRKRSERDRRQVEIRLTPKGERCLYKVVELHEAERRALRGAIPIMHFGSPSKKNR